MNLNLFWVLFLILALSAPGEVFSEKEKPLGTYGDFLRSEITAASPLSDREKIELVEFVRGQHQEGVSFKDKWNADWILFFETTANDSSKSLEAMKEDIREYWDRKKEENKGRAKADKEQAKALRAKMKAEF